MIDCHIHLERGTYTLDWIYEFINNAIKNNIKEIWLLEHCYRFREFLSMYDSVCVNSKYIDTWFHRKAGVINLSDFLNFTDIVRQEKFPIKIKFGLEICYFQKFENFIYNLTKDSGLDFLVGSVHYVDDFAFDHKAEHWMGIDVDKTYHRYFQMSIDLAKSGIFNGIAHPDCIKLFGHKPSFLLNDYYDKLAKALAQGNMYAEQNSGAYRRCPMTAGLGMNVDLIKAMKQYKVNILTASDAHCPEDVGAFIPNMIHILNDIE